ncbi:MAG: hypothetical protein KF819_16620 [Labilithrix sp.]|nr:hypothetical protein [Labilithrix sp.]
MERILEHTEIMHAPNLQPLALPFPIPEAPPPSPARSFPFPPPIDLRQASTARTRVLWTVPHWLPRPVEGAAYFLVGATLGCLFASLVVTIVT